MPKGLRSITVGKRLRQIRASRDLTLAQVRELTGISISTLSKLEKGQTSLNFDSMMQLIEGLNVPLSSLVGPKVPQHSGRRAITRNDQGRFFETPQLRFEVLCGDLSRKHNVFWKVTVKARSVDEYAELSSHPGEEFIYVLKGKLKLHTEIYEPVVLGAGDSIFFDSSVGHAYVSSGRGNAEILISNSVSQSPLEGFVDEAGVAVNRKRP